MHPTLSNFYSKGFVVKPDQEKDEDKVKRCSTIDILVLREERQKPENPIEKTVESPVYGPHLGLLIVLDSSVGQSQWNHNSEKKGNQTTDRTHFAMTNIY